MREVVIVGKARTAIGRFQGALSAKTAPQLGAVAIAGALKNAGVSSEDVDEVIMGEVLSAGVGQAPARQAALYAGLPTKTPCMTINKVCGSGLKAVMLARQSIALGQANVVVAGGMESMSNAPYLLPTARDGMRMGHGKALDSMIHDGLWDPYGDAHMGGFGDSCAKELDITRDAQDTFAKESYERAQQAQADGSFDNEIVPVEIKTRKGVTVVDKDEEPPLYRPEKMGDLRPAFGKEGSVTAANASKINDGAAALILMSREEAEKRGCTILASLVSDGTFAQDPAWFTTAPVGAMKNALEAANMSANDIDCFEINEAFSMVAMAAIRELELDRNKVNCWGGAVSLGHPIGCSGARILVTLLSVMEKDNLKTGCASLCIGGGEGVALIVQRS
ncbi:MAG: acetyl-CoA C-acyltransferase [Myxococcales bacterium]|nr:acetyl-CoA C-acyltransferase [Myxococcales bacterium]